MNGGPIPLLSPLPTAWRAGTGANTLINEWLLPLEKVLGLSDMSSVSEQMGTFVNPQGRGHVIREVSHCRDPEMPALGSLCQLGRQGRCLLGGPAVTPRGVRSIGILSSAPTPGL